MSRWLLFSILLTVPQTTVAAVYISEIAWMGTSASANDEWIELHNDRSSAVSLVGWRVTDNGNFDVVLEGAGSVAPGAFAVLERTDDSSAPGSAFYIYTGSLPNTGATLRLYDSNGSLVDQVAGGENWENIGGDNTTKETAQYTSSGWVTATPTPGAGNTQSANQADDTAATSPTETVSRSSNSKKSSKNQKEEITPTTITIDAPTLGVVGEPITFTAVVTGGTKWSRGGQDTTWNFGDTFTSTDRTPTHQYQYPGTYIVSLQSEYDDEAATLYHEITIVPLRLSVTQDRRGAVQVSNDAPYDVPLGGVTIAAGERTYTFPPETHLKANNTITLPPQTFTATPNSVLAIHNQLDQVVSYRLPPAAAPVMATAEAVAQPPAAPRLTPTTTSPPAKPTGDTFSFVSEHTPAPQIMATSTAAASIVPPTQTAAVIEAIPGAQTAASADAATSTRYAYLGLIGLLLVTIFALLSRRVTASGNSPENVVRLPE